MVVLKTLLTSMSQTKITANKMYSKTRTNFTISQKQNKTKIQLTALFFKVNVKLQQTKEAFLNTKGCNISPITIASMPLYHNRPVLR